MSDYRLIKAYCWNNGNPNEPGNEFYWLLSETASFPTAPLLFKHLQKVAEYIEARDSCIAGNIEPSLQKAETAT